QAEDGIRDLTVTGVQTCALPISPDSTFQGNFVLTALTASADEVPGDQVNLHRVRAIQRVTATSWQNDYPVENCLDPRNENGWSRSEERRVGKECSARGARELNRI